MPDPTGDFSPTIRRRRLSEELKQLRAAAGLTLEQAAQKLEWSRAKIANIETGKRLRPYVTDIGLLLDVYGVTDREQREALFELTRQSRIKGWWTRYSDFAGAYFGLEAEASSIATYQVGAVPGLLQTPEYTAALARAALTPEDDVERVVAARERRQGTFERQAPPTLTAIIDEAALARPATAASPEVMQAQIRSLLKATENPHITVQVLPFSTGLHAGTGGPFVLLDFPNPTDRPVVFLETRHEGLYLEAEHQVTDYRNVLEHLQDTALSPAESQQHLTRLID
ncbi:helix-turn-helix domain-containing protein [Nocardiopsis sp. HNM0947]|uniref:Helix-turn-helix domain-containing protein n=1 Tax=Nocardiopsis coralli TaxID=2772213 RepID=A0ABR9P8K7_9ACTN|nr:helix-turn-helix transcriptional regulator [Nocardiopsis coralli]MBE3000154.1 helix-turn-helix domain-containing protein [Nocardiopsis coralli]